MQAISQLLEKSNRIAKENNYGVMIRMGTDMKLKSLKNASMDDSFFELPSGAEVFDMDSAMNEMQEDQEYPGNEEYSESENAISQDAKDVGQAARDEVKNATVDEVRKGVRGLFDKVFN
ncbi:MAG: hypothetical protein JW927_15595 [Deltaproteobacteria bacterium]|nr:hypothetical protein [Deltaproteobacteria bacterium]